MEGTKLLSLPEGMLVEQIQINENGLVIAGFFGDGADRLWLE